MFRQLRNTLVGQPRYLLVGQPVYANALAASNGVLGDFRPSQLSEYLEQFWNAPLAFNVAPPFPPAPAPVPPAPRPDIPAHFTGEGLAVPVPAAAPIIAGNDGERQLMARNAWLLDGNLPGPPPGIWWHHLVYAYMLENTRVVDIFFKVVAAYANSEKLPPATPETQRWLRNIEELFFTTPRQHSIRSLTSNIRPDAGAIRRNAYYRLLGMDINHGTEDGRPYPFHKPEAANRDFPALFEEFLREVWKAYMNRLNFIGPRATDDEAIKLLVQRLREMLNSRRWGGTLTREEFDAVATLSWFHLTLEENTQVVNNLTAQASSPAERLRSIAARVGLPPNSRADAYFRMAEPISHVLLDIENGGIEALGVQELYTNAGIYTQDMLTVITQWSIATGRDIKESVGIRGAVAPVGGPSVRTGVPVSGDGGARRPGVPV